MPAKDALKWVLIRVLGYGRFLMAVFYFRYIWEILSQGRSELAGVARLIKPDHTVFDVGANIGYTAAVFARTSARTVYAFEPDPDNFRCLRRTSLRRKNVVPVRCGIGAADGCAVLQNVVKNGVKQHALSRLRLTGDGPGVQQTVIRSIDSFNESLEGAVGLIKIDVEGFETEVLRGMLGTIARDRPVLYVEVCGDEALVQYSEFAARHGYAIYRWIAGRFQPVDRLSRSGNYLFADAALP